MFENFTKKQRKFIYDIIKGNTKRINILEGSVRSGKTYVSLIAWIILLSQLPQDHNYLMVGKTLTSLKRNFLSILEGICPTDSFEYSTIKKEAKIFGRRVFLEGVNDTRGENYAAEQLKKRENIDNFVDRAVDLKLTETLKTVVKLNEKSVTLDEFNKLMEGK